MYLNLIKLINQTPFNIKKELLYKTFKKIEISEFIKMHIRFIPSLKNNKLFGGQKSVIYSNNIKKFPLYFFCLKYR